jgi:hypothetical protein
MTGGFDPIATSGKSRAWTRVSGQATGRVGEVLAVSERELAQGLLVQGAVWGLAGLETMRSLTRAARYWWAWIIQHGVLDECSI